MSVPRYCTKTMQDMRKQGYSYNKIAKVVGCNKSTVTRHLSLLCLSETGVHLSTQAKIDAVEHMKHIPKDTRNYTSRFFGDPLPGRSALDQLQQGEQ